jgi:hypothetical protein
MSRSHSVLKAFRLTHLYVGVLITPALLFFALTGALQTFGLHESSPNSSYKPPAWVVTLAQIHKKQTMIVPQRRPRPAEPASEPATGAQAVGDHEGHHHGAGDAVAASPATAAPIAVVAPAPNSPLAHVRHPLPLKIFFLLVSLGLFLSTFTGLYMTWKYTRNRILIVLLLIAGVVVPVALLWV